jgi:predicted dehydrogenase
MSHPPLRIGIAGARGFGKHHAKWFARAGCEVVAVYGTTEESAEKAAAGLRESLDFTGRVFHDWSRFVDEGSFDACSVASPPDQHYRNVRDLAAAGKHVMCEKPLVWNWSYTPYEIVEEATRLVEAGAHHGVVLGVNAQYPAGLPGWKELYRRIKGQEPEFRSLYFIMETKNPPRSPHGPAEAWVDLGPHPLAWIDALAPGGVDWDTLRHEDGPTETVIDFEWLSDGRAIPVHIECRRTTDGSVRRRLGNQDLIVECEGARVDGEFAAKLRVDDQEWIGPDFMQVSIERFIEAAQTGDEGRLLVSGTAALRQLEALVGVWQRAWA